MIKNLIIKFVVLIIIVAIKTVFASFETAITYLNKAKFNQMCKNPKLQSRKKTLRLKKFIDNKMKTFGITRMGLTVTEQLASAFTAEAFVNLIVSDLKNRGLQPLLAYIICVAIITLILSYVTMLFGELLPKKAARNHPERTAYRLVNLFTVFSILNVAFEKILTVSEVFFSKLLNIKDEPEEKLTEKELKLIIAESKSQGLFNADEKKLLFNAIKFDSIKVKDIMIPKDKIIMINIDSSSKKIAEKIQKSRHTRIPVYEKHKENIIGYINIKDMLYSSIENDGLNIDFDIRKLIRKPLFIDKNDKISSAFKEMQLNNLHIALIKNSSGEIEGLLTEEDVIEKLVGNILDEYEKK